MSLAVARRLRESRLDDQRITCDSAEEWNWRKEKQKLLRGRVHEVFLTCDIHISHTIKTSLKLHTGWLQRLYLSDKGCNLSDGDVRAIVARNQHLRDVNLYAPNLTDKTLISILKHCRLIGFIGVHGLPSKSGRIKGHFVDFMNRRENDRAWPFLKRLWLDNQPIEEAQMRSVTKKRHSLEIRQSIALTPAVAKALSNAGINIPNAEDIKTTWCRGHVVGIDWVALVRREQKRLDDLERLATQLREEQERQLSQELKRQQEISDIIDQFGRWRDIARLEVDSAHSGTEETGSEESCSEAEESGDDGLDDLDARRLGSYEDTTEEEDSEANELEEEEGILEEEESEADELEEGTGEEHSNEEDCSPEEIGGEEEDDDDERYQNEEEARPSIKAERIAQTADQEIPRTESRYWAPVERNTGATIKQENRLSVANSLPREPASIPADEEQDVRIANGTHLQDERQLSDHMVTDSEDELVSQIKSESRIPAQNLARFGNDITRFAVFKDYYPHKPSHPNVFAGSVTLRFGSPEDWDRRWKRAQRRTGIRMVTFEPSFAVTIAHINALAWSPPAFSSSVVAVHVYNGSLLDDQTITSLAGNLTQLEQVQLDLAPNLGDQSILSLLEYCHAITYIKVCGNQVAGHFGRVTLRNLDAIFIANENQAQHLRSLVLVDQLVKAKSVEACERLRASLEIIRGYHILTEAMPASTA